MRSGEPTVRARTLDGFVPLVGELGGNAAQILTRMGLPPDATARPLDWISFPAVLRAYEVAASETRCKTFGLRLGATRQLSFLGPLQLIVSYSRNLRSGFEAFCRFASVQNTGYRPYLDVGPEEATFQLILTSQLRRWGEQWMEDSLVTALRLLRGCLGAQYVPRRVSLRHAAISDRATYERHFGTDVHTEAPVDGVTTDSRDLEVVNARRDDEVLSVLTDFLRADAAPARTDVTASSRESCVARWLRARSPLRPSQSRLESTSARCNGACRKPEPPLRICWMKFGRMSPSTTSHRGSCR